MNQPTVEQRDKLAEMISCHDSYHYFEDERGSGSECSCGTEICPGLEYAPAAHVGHLTDALLVDGYRRLRTVTAADELDKLPLGSVVACITHMSGSPLVITFQRGSFDTIGSGWATTDAHGLITSEKVFEFIGLNGLPMELTVLHEERR
ncbi:hypothetical protein [Sinomonas soli]